MLLLLWMSLDSTDPVGVSRSLAGASRFPPRPISPLRTLSAPGSPGPDWVPHPSSSNIGALPLKYGVRSFDLHSRPTWLRAPNRNHICFPPRATGLNRNTVMDINVCLLKISIPRVTMPRSRTHIKSWQRPPPVYPLARNGDRDLSRAELD